MQKDILDLWNYEPSTEAVREALSFIEDWHNTDCGGDFAESVLWKLRDDAQFLARFCIIMFQLSDERTLMEILVFLSRP
jgi:hypothetical protein